jgi:AhpD family alkylhydroperoxidase
MANLKSRMKNPVVVVPDALQHLLTIGNAAKSSNLPDRTIGLVHLRASQINGCGFCVDMHARDLNKAGETDERLWAVAAWHESPHFSDAERAALALTEANRSF